MAVKTPDEVAKRYSRNPPKLTVTTFFTSGENVVLLEGSARAFRMLGEMLIATADQKAGFDFAIHPHGAGRIFFNDAATHGIYLNLMNSSKNR